MVNYFALIVALALSVVSGSYSVYGLTAIFPSAFYPVIFMGGVLEVAKLVTASWLYRNWNIAKPLLKAYLTSAVVILMFITSMGTFGFLSKAHIDQSLNAGAGTTEQIQIINNKIELQKQSLGDIDKQISQIDSAISKLTERGQASTSLKAAEQQRKTRDALVRKKEDFVRNISQLNEQRFKLETSIKKIEAEVGPLKYIAELIYGQTNDDLLEKAVRWVILIIVFVFDPLAVVLLIAANVGLQHKKNLLDLTNPAILSIEDDILRQGENNVAKRKAAEELDHRPYSNS